MKLILLALLSLLFITPARADNPPSACLQKKPYKSDVTINIEVPEPYYDLTRTKAYLNNDGGRAKQEWLKKNNMQSVWSSKHMTTMGLAEGAWAANYRWTIDPEPLDQYWAYACLYVRRLEIDMIFRTMIIIPKDYPQKSCDFEVIHEHELKHYNVNRMVALKTAKRLEDDMPKILATLESPHAGSHAISTRAEDIKKSLRELVDVYFKQVMREEMKALNGKIDSPEEYSSHDKYVRACEERRRRKTPDTAAN